VSKKVKACKHIIEQTGAKIEFIDNNNTIWAHHACISVKVDEKLSVLSIGFHVNLDPGWAAILALRLGQFASENHMAVIVHDCLAFDIDDNGDIAGMCTGLDAYELVGREPFLPEYY